MPPPDFSRQLRRAARNWWREQAQQNGRAGAAKLLARELWGFLRDSTPERRRQRYGDMGYDWEHRVNTTSGTVGWRERLLGVFLSAYQPTDPAAFQEMMASLPIDLPESALRHLVERLEKSLAQSPRPVWIVYHNPVLEPVVVASSFLRKAGATGCH